MKKRDPDCCPCPESDDDKARKLADEKAALLRRHVRPIRTPRTRPRSSERDEAKDVVEVTVRQAGRKPIQAIVPEDADIAKIVRALEGKLEDFPRLNFDKHEGALDVLLEVPRGGQVKTGTVLLEPSDGNGQPIALRLDPATRRFRSEALPAGRYRLMAASARHGRATQEIEVRAGDIARVRLGLDGQERGGKRNVQILVRGTTANSLQARVTDRDTGFTAFSGEIKLRAGLAVFEGLPLGRFHFELDDGSAKSCYDADIDDFDIALPGLDDLQVLLEPFFPHGPIIDPRDPFGGLPEGLAGLGQLLPKIGVRSLEELASVEPEALVHRANALREEDGASLPATGLSRAVTVAREWTGRASSEGLSIVPLALATGSSTGRKIRSRLAGSARAKVSLRAGTQARLIIETTSGVAEHAVVDGSTVEFRTDGGQTIESVRLVNDGSDALFGEIELFLPGALVPVTPSAQTSIDGILSSLAPTNPGMNSAQPAIAIGEGNIRARLDRARSLMREAGVCSLNDLGTLRLVPSRKFQPGLYVAPKKVNVTLATAQPLSAWALAEVIDGSVLRYEPNDMIHQSAVICADTWDIRGQTIVLGAGVRDFFVIARRIEHDAGTRITWEQPNLPSASSYWPSPAANGANGVPAGADGQAGTSGDQDPPASKNGGSNAIATAPNMEMWVLDTTNGLPAIDLAGQEGETGGLGQKGGRGGDGQCGRRAHGHWYSGCCRGVGFGGDGGRGGNGGRGGRGGTGGRGGELILMTAADGLAGLAGATPSVDVGPGAGGSGGTGGNPGAGGTGGPPGTADCEPWCDEHPERRGDNGSGGSTGSQGLGGSQGPDAAENAVMLFPVTEEEWEQTLNNPHILEVLLLAVCPGDTVKIRGVNFDPAVDQVYFDGVSMGSVDNATEATFTVPLTSEGSWHPVVVRDPSDPDRRSNKVMVQVLPVLDELPALGRWVEGDNITLTGLAIRPGAVVIAEDTSATPVKSWILPVGAITRTSIVVNVPAAPLADLRGVRRIKVRNPDPGDSKEERVARLGQTIVVRVAAFRIVDSGGSGTLRSAAEITDSLTEGTLFSVSTPWAAADIAFELVQPVSNLVVDSDLAQLWPIRQSGVDYTVGKDAYTNAPGVDGALNLFFVRDLELATAFMMFGGGPAFIGDEGSKLGPVDFQQVVSHEIGHGLCLRHICDAGEGPGTFFNRACQSGDEAFLMYPFWDTSDGMALDPGQFATARSTATHFETGKTSALTAADFFSAGISSATACGGDDTDN